MKLTLWQQFSSNHSASFSVVGRFESPEEAEASAVKIREVLEAVRVHYRQRFPDIYDYLQWSENFDLYGLSHVEETIRKAWKIRRNAWLNPLDWAYNITPVEVFNNLVFISSQGDVWGSFQPLDSLIKRLGGKFYGAQEDYGSCSFSIVCDAPDLDTAKALETELAKVDQHPDYTFYNIQIPDTDIVFQGKVERKGLKLHFKNLSIYANSRDKKYDSPGHLAALVPYLETKGCQNFQYKLKENRR